MQSRACTRVEAGNILIKVDGVTLSSLTVKVTRFLAGRSAQRSVTLLSSKMEGDVVNNDTDPEIEYVSSGTNPGGSHESRWQAQTG